MGLSETSSHFFFFVVVFEKNISLYLFNSLSTQDLNTLAKEDILWADMAIFIFWLEELRAFNFFFNAMFRMWAWHTCTGSI